MVETWDGRLAFESADGVAFATSRRPVLGSADLYAVYDPLSGLADNGTPLILDASACEESSDALLGLLMQLAVRARKASGWLGLCGARPAASQQLDELKVLWHFRQYPDLEMARLSAPGSEAGDRAEPGSAMSSGDS
jgi:hypothetical protein